MPKIVFQKNRLSPADIEIEAASGTTVLEAAEENNVPLGSSCGGVCGCSKCHVYVLEGLDSLEEMSDEEEDRLDLAFDVRLSSRLACQATLGSSDLVVEITAESLQAFLDEHPALRKRYEETGALT